MNIKSLLGGMAMVAGLASAPAFALPDLVASGAGYFKPGCDTAWQLMEGYSMGHQGYGVGFSFSCPGHYVAKKVATYNNQNVLTSCTVSLLNTTYYTLSTSNCNTFEIYQVSALPNFNAPAAPAWAQRNSGTPTWAAVSGANHYELLVGSYGALHTTTATSSTLDVRKVRACNSQSYCSLWTTVTP